MQAANAPIGLSRKLCQAYGVWTEVMPNLEELEQVKLQSTTQLFYNMVVGRVQTVLNKPYRDFFYWPVGTYWECTDLIQYNPATKGIKYIQKKSITLAKKEPEKAGGLLSVGSKKGKKGARPTSAHAASARVNTGRVVASRIDTGRVASAKKGTKKKMTKFTGFHPPNIQVGNDALFHASLDSGETTIYTNLANGHY